MTDVFQEAVAAKAAGNEILLFTSQILMLTKQNETSNLVAPP